MLEKFNVTLEALRKAGACFDGYNKVVRAIEGKEFTEEDIERGSYIHCSCSEPISIISIAENNGVDDAFWALRCIKNAESDRDIRLIAVWCAREVEYLMTDIRSKQALIVAERYADGLATKEELDAARAAAWAAGDAARAAARAAGDAAWAAARAAAWAAGDAAMAAARAAAWAAGDAAMAAGAAAWAAARAAQKEMLIKMCNGEAPWQINRKG